MPTALKLTSDERKRYLEAVRRRPALLGLGPDEQSQRAHLLGRIREVAAILKTRYGVRRVVLFGSLAHAAWFTADSDVDLAVEGLASKDYWQAWRVVEEMIGGRSVDLIDIEMAGESLSGAIRRYGVEL